MTLVIAVAIASIAAGVAVYFDPTGTLACLVFLSAWIVIGGLLAWWEVNHHAPHK